jgi:hypothetical protein
VFLTVILDAYPRRLIGLALSRHIEESFMLAALHIVDPGSSPRGNITGNRCYPVSSTPIFTKVAGSFEAQSQ